MPISGSNNPRCLLICVGSELLRGKLNTHASHIARRLASIGLSLDEENTVSDELPRITAAIRRGIERFPVVFISGGLGPTFDDLTREAASEATGRSLILSAKLLKGLKAKFHRAHYSMPAANARQAYFLEGAHAIENKNGTAPGQWVQLQRRWGDGELGREGAKAVSPDRPISPSPNQVLILLPGPPRELYPMLDDFVLPHLKRLFPPRPTAEAHLHFVGAPESVVDAKVRPIIAREQKKAGASVQFTILAHLGLVDFDVFVSANEHYRAKAARDRIVRAVRQAVGKAWYGTDADYPLEKVVGNRFRQKRVTLAVAESCTGGLLASRLTEIPGSSDYFVEGWVTYANTAKMQAIGVSGALLKKHGAVSKPAAIAMARGVREHANSTWGVGITGIAGPGGGTPKKPLGLVYIALASANKTICRSYHFSGDRSVIRQRAVLAVLDHLRKI